MTDVLVAVVVVGVLAALVLGLVLWARGGAPYDDGTASTWVPYVPEDGEERHGSRVADDDPVAHDGRGRSGEREPGER